MISSQRKRTLTQNFVQTWAPTLRPKIEPYLMKITNLRSYTLTAAASSLLAFPLVGQDSSDDSEEIFELSPFEVSPTDREGYQAVDTLAGNRLNTKLKDVGSSLSVTTTQFLKDTGAVDNQTLLQYTAGTEVGGPEGNFGGNGDGALLDESANFVNPNQNTRVRGLTQADNARDFFISEIPWDAYNVDRVELQRGPNSILFGQGSPAGLVNVGLKSAAYDNSGEIEVRFDEHGSTRLSLDLNKVLIEDELAIRLAVLNNNAKYQQKPAFSDDQRIFLTGRWDPKMINGDNSRATFKVSYENGQVNSNNPRSLPPIDRITPWFQTGTYEGRYLSDGNTIVNGELVPVSKGDTRIYNHLNKETFNAHQLQQDNVYYPNHGQGRPGINGGPYSGAYNPAYNPLIGSFAENFGGPINYFGDGPTSPDIWQQEIRESRGIDENGNVVGGIGSFSFNRAGGIATQADFARNAGLPFGEFGVYKNNNITDTSIFDFYNTLIDGENKEEWQDFDYLNMSYSQTFMGDMVGFDITYNNQNYDNGQLSLLSGSQQSLYIDIMGVYPDGTPDGALNGGGIPHGDGTPNPNVGRPFVSDKGQFGNNSFSTERESLRVTPFVRYDLTRGDGNWFTRIIGSGTFTGLYSDDKLLQERRSWQQYAILDQSYIDFLEVDGLNNFADSILAPSTVAYLGGSLSSASTASGSNIPGISGKLMLPRNAMTRIFDSTWAGGSVDPAAEWINNTFLPPELEYPDFDPSNPDAVDGDGELLWPDSRLSTQSENMANYVGWTNVPYTLTASEDSPENRELLARSAALDRKHTESEALVWQGKLLDDSIIGTYGWRKDTVSSAAFNQANGDHLGERFGHLNFDPSYYTLDNSPVRELEVQSRAYSIVAHLDKLPFLSGVFDNSPVLVSLFYNESSNFQPESARVDAYGEALSAPSGETTDQGIMIETRDGKYSLKVNKYESTVTNASSGAISGAWFIGASQAWAGDWVNRYEYDFTSTGPEIATTMANNRPAGASVPPNFSLDRIPADNPDFDETNSMYNYGTAPGETLADAQAREAAAVAAWRTWQASVDPRFYEAWGVDLDAPFAAEPTEITAVTATPQNFAVTEDSVSKGYEIEFSARPTENWNILVNASQVEAVRNNIGGTALSEFIEGYSEALNNTAAGDVRIWWGGAGNETSLFQWNTNVGSEWTSRKLQEGTAAPELREWRWNAITNYDFTEGKLKGLNVGAGLRWQDSVIIGYRPIPGETDTQVSFDLANPYTGPSEMHIDLWAGYQMELNDDITWKIQLNVRNAFDDDGLIPITAQPDGTPAGYRIAPSQSWAIRNTFSF